MLNAYFKMSFLVALARRSTTAATAHRGAVSRRTFLRDISSLSKWHAAVVQVPLTTILPLGFGAVRNDANVAAFFGDRRINLAVALTLQRLSKAPDANHEIAGVPWLSKVQSEAVSNQMFASHIEDILPVQGKGLLDVALSQPHDGGTIVEAAVEAVASSMPGGMAGKEAVDDLAKWLVEKALSRGSTNHKGDLLEFGGTVESQRLEGYEDHAPLFLATAKLGDVICEAEGRSKLEAEQAAAGQVFNLLGLQDGSSREFVKVERRIEYERKGGEDESHDFIEFYGDVAMNLRGGEDEKGWWLRGAAKPNMAFHRAMMAPYAFPDNIYTVKSWSRLPVDSKNEKNFVLVVIIGKPLQQERRGCIVARSFLEVGETKSSARRAAGMKVNRFITEEILGQSFLDDGSSA